MEDALYKSYIHSMESILFILKSVSIHPKSTIPKIELIFSYRLG